MMNKEERVIRLIEELESVFQIRVFLDHDPYKVLVRTILSQRTRDENTDQATNNLFEKYPDIHAVVDAPIDDVKELIRPAGFYNVKAARIQEVSRILIDQYGGEVPDTVEEMIKLPGVGRKTANCVMVFAFELPAIPVDTHVHRISNRLGLVDTKNPDDTEVELCRIAPRDLWIKLNDLMVQFGQNICKPIGPQCEVCPCTDICDYFSENI
ncbi:endonuclease III [uncultured Methanobrevibacter sp.]|uniref:endonuclease III domain-containing protein n=1 Tax=uncultured Methanobrevibacter sp. TaxID=253161 RepID=UPI0025E6FFFC|nr:endonuclease III [uncultured Methanobrevibacter sp.]MDO5810500.1 endonuclease III [Methanobrevibacter sp.]